MNPSRLTSIAILLLIAGCGRQEGVAHTTPTVSPPAITVDSPDSTDPPGVIVYSTGEAVAWPSIPLPLMEISFDLPEVPESLLGPFSEDILPAKE
jgi:hypothetical protein